MIQMKLCILSRYITIYRLFTLGYQWQIYERNTSFITGEAIDGNPWAAIGNMFTNREGEWIGSPYLEPISGFDLMYEIWGTCDGG
jgi:hypothetical protein